METLLLSICDRFSRSTASFLGRPLIRLGVDERPSSAGELPFIGVENGEHPGIDSIELQNLKVELLRLKN